MSHGPLKIVNDYQRQTQTKVPIANFQNLNPNQNFVAWAHLWSLLICTHSLLGKGFQNSITNAVQEDSSFENLDTGQHVDPAISTLGTNKMEAEIMA